MPLPLILLAAALAATTVAEQAPSESGAMVTLTWRVIVAREPYEPLCDDVAIRLRLLDAKGAQRAQYDVAVEDLGSRADGEWGVGALSEGLYSVVAETTGCAGKFNDKARVVTEVAPQHREKQVFLAAEQHDQLFQLLFLEVVSRVNAESLLSVVPDGAGGVTVENLSGRPIAPCAHPFGKQIGLQWLVDGEWGEFSHSQGYEWPGKPVQVEPRESVSLHRGVMVVRKHSKAKKVSAERKRFRLPIHPAEGNLVVVREPRELALIPACDVYEVELPVGSDDPQLFVRGEGS